MDNELYNSLRDCNLSAQKDVFRKVDRALQAGTRIPLLGELRNSSSVERLQKVDGRHR